MYIYNSHYYYSNPVSGPFLLYHNTNLCDLEMKYAIPVKLQFSAWTRVLRVSLFVAHSQFTTRSLFPLDLAFPSSARIYATRERREGGVEIDQQIHPLMIPLRAPSSHRTPNLPSASSFPSIRVLWAHNIPPHRIIYIFYYGKRLEFRPWRSRC